MRSQVNPPLVHRWQQLFYAKHHRRYEALFPWISRRLENFSLSYPQKLPYEHLARQVPGQFVATKYRIKYVIINHFWDLNFAFPKLRHGKEIPIIQRHVKLVALDSASLIAANERRRKMNVDNCKLKRAEEVRGGGKMERKGKDHCLHTAHSKIWGLYRFPSQLNIIGLMTISAVGSSAMKCFFWRQHRCQNWRK